MTAAGYWLTSQANRDLVEICQYVGRDRAMAADRLLTRFEKTFDLLAANPGMGQERPELADGLRRFSVRNYVLFFLPSSGGIQIIRILHGSRDVEQLF